MRTPEEAEERLDSIQEAIAEVFGEPDMLVIDGMSVERIAVRLAEMRLECTKAVLVQLLQAHQDLALAAVTFKRIAT